MSVTLLTSQQFILPYVLTAVVLSWEYAVTAVVRSSLVVNLHPEQTAQALKVKPPEHVKRLRRLEREGLLKLVAVISLPPFTGSRNKNIASATTENFMMTMIYDVSRLRSVCFLRQFNFL